MSTTNTSTQPLIHYNPTHDTAVSSSSDDDEETDALHEKDAEQGMEVVWKTTATTTSKGTTTTRDKEISTNSTTNETTSDTPPPKCHAHTSSKTATKSLGCLFRSIFNIMRTGLSILLLCVSLGLVGTAIVTRQTLVAHGSHPVVALVLLVFLLVWLALLEGGQGCLVGLQPLSQSSQGNNDSVPVFAASHRVTHKCTTMVLEKNRLEQFIVGRQFLVVLVVFGINMCGSVVAEYAASTSTTVWDDILPETVFDLMWGGGGLALMLVTIVVGQLTAQIVAASSLLDFCNTHAALVLCCALSLVMEASGLLHAVYLVKYLLFDTTTNEEKNDESKEEHESGTVTNNTTTDDAEAMEHSNNNKKNSTPTKVESQSSLSTSSSSSSSSSVEPRGRVGFWVRVLFSVAILATAFAVTLQAIFQEQTALGDGVLSPYAAVFVFVGLMVLVGLLEGLQIALLAVINAPSLEHIQSQSAMAYRTCVLVRGSTDADGSDGTNDTFSAFLVGRQILVTMCMFLVARITTIQMDDDKDETIFGVAPPVQEFFNTGLLGAILTTIVGSLVWRVIATAYPVAFLSNPILYLLVRLCLVLEASGICASAMVLARICQRVFGLRPDEYYLDHAAQQQQQFANNTTTTADQGMAGVDADAVNCKESEMQRQDTAVDEDCSV